MKRLALRSISLIATAWLLAGCPVVANQSFCAEDMDCGGGGNMACDQTTNECVQRQVCERHDQCMAPGMPICGGDMCRGCESAAECMERDPSFTECTTDGQCREPEPQVCEGSSECPAGRPMCNGTECVACTPDATGDAACAERSEEGDICIGGGTCGECRNDTHCTGADRPICDSDAGTCRACQANSECDSNVCDKLSGQCAAVANVIYVDGASGDDDNACDRAAPCKTISNALDLVEPDAHRYIRIEEGVYGQVLSINDKDVTLVGDGATIQPALSGENDRAVITVGSGSTVAIQGLQIQKASGNASADGVLCSSPDASVTIVESIVTDNDNRGVNARCSLTIERSIISQNEGGGIDISNTSFSITNSIIAGNGDAAQSPFGGVRIANAGSYSPQIFSFNTVVGNQALAGADASGVRCSTDTPMTASNNIVYRGIGGQAAVSGLCSWAYSNIEGGFSGTGNIDEDPMFVDSTNGDYHIQPGSPCENAADPAASSVIDFDGDIRPQGSGPDMGADEIVSAPAQ